MPAARKTQTPKTTKTTTRKPRAAAAAAPAPTAEFSIKRVTFKDAAEQVLRAAAGPMKVKAIAELAIPLVTPTPAGKTPAATLGAHLITDANKGGRFVKTAPGTFDVREINPRGAAKRPTSRKAKVAETSAAMAEDAATDPTQGPALALVETPEDAA
jgi:HB1, ASXL, restriction endonuclease HTH domain